MAKHKKYIFIAASVLAGACLLLFISPIFSLEVAETGGYTLGLDIKPEVGHYATLELKAINAENIQFPKGTAELQWGKSPLARERFDIYIDNISHSYYVPLGENAYWQGSENIEALSLSLPQVEGVEYQLENIMLSRRAFPPLDSYINSYFKYLWRIDGINRFLVPSYMLLAFTALAVIIYISAFKKLGLNPVVPISLMILTLFSAYFFIAQIYTARSYYISYEHHIEQRDFSNTYHGFYDLRKFISWIDQELPDGENLAVLVRGEPVYIMSEMAYNLYPRGIRFINISQKTHSEIMDELVDSGKTGHSHIIIFSPEDRVESFRLNRLGSYTEEAGFIYRFTE